MKMTKIRRRYVWFCLILYLIGSISLFMIARGSFPYLENLLTSIASMWVWFSSVGFGLHLIIFEVLHISIATIIRFVTKIKFIIKKRETRATKETLGCYFITVLIA
jgi:hypothetical protein